MYTIYFDMDGTIANLYEVENWLSKIRSENPSPYIEAMPLIDTEKFSEIIIDLQNVGFKIGVISWTAKNGSNSYNKVVRKAKLEWLAGCFPEIIFDEVHIVKYGTRKDYVAKDKDGIIFDDDDKVREKWRGEAINPNTEDIIEILKGLTK